MKRLHLHVKTDDLAGSVRFYQALFGKAPDRLEADYAKWLLDDPCAHVSVSTHGAAPGFDHVGISLESPEALADHASRAGGVGAETLNEPGATCCYAQSNKVWTRDPNGVVWELFETYADADAYGAEPDRTLAEAPCCGEAGAAS